MDRLLATIMEDYYAGFAWRILEGKPPLNWIIQPVILIGLAMSAIGGVLLDPGGVFWASWNAFAMVAIVGAKWHPLAVD